MTRTTTRSFSDEIIQRSIESLARGLEVTQIAFEAGYETLESFTRAFRVAYGSAPSGFRRRSGELCRALPTRARERPGMGEGPTYELYLNSPMEVAKEELRTELYVHLREDPRR